MNTIQVCQGDGSLDTRAAFGTRSSVKGTVLLTHSDAVGNITEITQGTTSITYEYDAANRLIRENNGVTNQTIVYDYTNDLWGNIQSKTVYPYTTATNPGTPTGTNTYTYGNTDWGDRLTSYNGQTFTYDSMGNPTSYRGYTFGWRGKQLTSASNGTNTLTFEYNEDGLRQSKTCNNITTDYYYNGSVLIGMQRGQTKYLFSYDAGGNVVSVKQGDNEYYYLRNAQGDIVKLIDASGAVVVEYTYDTWGKKVTTTGSLAGTLGLFQPFRYRGYVYDWETGFYYLQSRYYDPTTGRFISADVLLSTGQGVMGHNCYAYCRNNPASRSDTSGKTDEKVGEDPLIDGGADDDTPSAILQAYLDYLVDANIKNRTPISFEEFLNQKIEEDIGLHVKVYNGYFADYGRPFTYDIFIDFSGWDNLREEIKYTSIQEIAERIVKKGREKYKDAFHDDFPLSEGIMNRKARKAIKNYLSAYETTFFGNLFKRPFGWAFVDEKEVRSAFHLYIF